MQAGLVMINMSTKFEVSITHYEDTKSNAKWM